MNLIKIKEDLYVVVDGKPKVGRYAYSPRRSCIVLIGTEKGIEDDELLVTHSTQPIEDYVSDDSFKNYEFISLQQVKEIISDDISIDDDNNNGCSSDGCYKIIPKTSWELEIIDNKLKIK